MKKFLGIVLLGIAAVTIAANASADPGPKYGFGERGLWMKPAPDAKFTVSGTGDMATTQWISSATALTAVAHVFPTGTKWVKITPATRAHDDSGWTGTATGNVTWSDTYSGDVDGGDAWGLTGAETLEDDGSLTWKGLDVGAQGATMYEFVLALPPLRYAVSYGVTAN